MSARRPQPSKTYLQVLPPAFRKGRGRARPVFFFTLPSRGLLARPADRGHFHPPEREPRQGHGAEEVKDLSISKSKRRRRRGRSSLHTHNRVPFRETRACNIQFFKNGPAASRSAG